jgi:hypothetical protein
MADIFDRIRGRAASVITKFGAPVTFRGAMIPAIEDPPGVWSAPVPALEFTGRGIQTSGNPEQIELSPDLILRNPIIVLVAADGLGGIPMPEMTMVWNGIEFIVNTVKAVAPNGNPIYYVIVGVT